MNKPRLRDHPTLKNYAYKARDRMTARSLAGKVSAAIYIVHIIKTASLQCLGGTEQGRITELSNTASQGACPVKNNDHELGSQAGQVEPTAEEISKMGPNTLLEWIQRKLDVPLDEE